MSEKKREEKHRITVYLNDDAYQGLQSYVTANYSVMNTYGAISDAVNFAVTSCYTTPTTSQVTYTLPIIKEEKQKCVT